MNQPQLITNYSFSKKINSIIKKATTLTFKIFYNKTGI